MDIYIAEKIRTLRMERGISQEKLAQYLNVSFQAVSKWENGNSYPDITLLPELARFFNVTVDELLNADRLDEQKLYAEYEKRARALYNSGDIAGSLSVWQEAYRDMPNNPSVKEMLMSAYFDVDKVKYQKEIIELGSALYYAPMGSYADEEYYRGQAICEIARTYAANGDPATAGKWAKQASCLMHAQEFLFTEVTEGEDRLSWFRHANYWYLKELFYMACRISEDKKLSQSGYANSVFRTLAQVYDAAYPDGDVDCDMLGILCTLHRCIAEDEAGNAGDEGLIREHLSRAVTFAEKAKHVKEHLSKEDLIRGMQISASPEGSRQEAGWLKEKLSQECFTPYCGKEWFTALQYRLAQLT